MSEETPSSTVPYDLDRLKELIKLMEDHGLTEVDLHQGDRRCRLRRGPLEGGFSAMPTGAFMSATAAPAAAATPAAPTAAKPVADNTLAIKSPTIGTFYSAASPDDPPFVKVGSQVKPDTLVCLVEAMKVYNQIQAECSGVVTEVCVANGDPVEFGQVLFRVQPG